MVTLIQLQNVPDNQRSPSKNRKRDTAYTGIATSGNQERVKETTYDELLKEKVTDRCDLPLDYDT